MKWSTLIGWLLTFGVAQWLSGRVVDTHPAFALAVMLAIMVFSALVVARPHRGAGSYPNTTNPMNTASCG